MRRFTRESLLEAAKSRPEGYVEAVLTAAVKQDDTHVWLTPEAFADIRERFTSPSLLQKAKNFATSAAKHIRAGMPRCTQEQIDERFAICQGCEFYKDGACQKCGCPLKRERQFISKLSWAHEKCPVGKWGPVGQ